MINIFTKKIPMKFKEYCAVYNFSDVHFDSRKCDRKLLKKHFDACKEENGLIILNGDTLDVMGATRDPRSIANDIRPEYNREDVSYLDAVIFDLYEFLKPYKDNILMIAYGNHETNIVRRQQTDPLKRLHQLLGNKDIILGGYQNAIKFQFKIHKDGAAASSVWFLHHGMGGGAKRSKGILSADLLASQFPFADVISCGHDHNKWHFPLSVSDVNFKTSKWKTKRVEVLRTGSYKKKSDSQGWEVEKGFNKPTLGGYKVNYYWSSGNVLEKDVHELK